MSHPGPSAAVIVLSEDERAELVHRAGLPGRWRADRARIILAREPPVLRCPALANHRDPVTTNHLPGGKPESAAKTRTARLRRSTRQRTTKAESSRARA